MAENSRPPVAIRIVRPYETEESFLENELETVGKTSVILIGAHSRPTGVILRFEVTLASGATVLRGEGRVLAHKENAFRGQAGLALRFTRLDPKSKALVDRAATIREARLSGERGESAPAASAQPPPPEPSAPSLPVSVPAPSSSSAPPPPREASLPPDPVLAQILTSPTPPPPALDAKAGRRSIPSARRSERPTGAPPPPSEAPLPPRPSTLVTASANENENANGSSDVAAQAQAITSLPAALDVPALEAAVLEAEAAEAAEAIQASEAVVPSGPPQSAPQQSSAAPADRDSLLSRLRQRALALTDEQKAAILRSS
ncbi:MAG: Chaperone protein DnaK [Labilithrix sp.]|nr:Chaperone protein DnaK [Labilithrix sp.]